MNHTTQYGHVLAAALSIDLAVSHGEVNVLTKLVYGPKTFTRLRDLTAAEQAYLEYLVNRNLAVVKTESRPQQLDVKVAYPHIDVIRALHAKGHVLLNYAPDAPAAPASRKRYGSLPRLSFTHAQVAKAIQTLSNLRDFTNGHNDSAINGFLDSNPEYYHGIDDALNYASLAIADLQAAQARRLATKS
jgi:hypothetical protein